MIEDEARKMEGISLVRTLPDNTNEGDRLVRLDFEKGYALYQLSPLNPEKRLTDLESELEVDYYPKMVKAGMDNAGNSYVCGGRLPRLVEVWPSEGVPCLEVRPYYGGSEEPENWSVALELVKL